MLKDFLCLALHIFFSLSSVCGREGRQDGYGIGGGVEVGPIECNIQWSSNGGGDRWMGPTPTNGGDMQRSA